MSIETAPLSGFRDLLPEQMIPRQKVLQKIEEVYQLYGFTPIETPILERLEVMSGKYGEEGEKLMYKFTDQGNRKVALRYDQTVPLARVAAEYQGKLPMPFKRYVVGPVFRGESPQKGRYRQFTQFDADTVGSSSSGADAEIIAMMHDSMGALGVETLIRVNNRRILDALAEKAGLPEESNMRSLVGTIDKIDKIGKTKVLQEIDGKFKAKVAQLVEEYLCVDGTAKNKLNALKKILGNSTAAQEGIESIDQVFSMLLASGYKENSVKFDPTIARGLDYYTGTIYETNLVGAEELGSVCSGGRYDNLIAALGGPQLPAVGTSIGVDRLLDGLAKLGKLEKVKTSTQVFVTNSGEDQSSYMQVTSQLRRLGIATEFAYETSKKGVGSQLQNADKQGIPYAIIYGDIEKAKAVVQLRNLKTRTNEEIPLQDLSRRIKEIIK